MKAIAVVSSTFVTFCSQIGYAQFDNVPSKHQNQCPAPAEVILPVKKALFADLTERCVALIPAFKSNTRYPEMIKNPLDPVPYQVPAHEDGSCDLSVTLLVAYQMQPGLDHVDGHYSYACLPTVP